MAAEGKVLEERERYGQEELPEGAHKANKHSINKTYNIAQIFCLKTLQSLYLNIKCGHSEILKFTEY